MDTKLHNKVPWLIAYYYPSPKPASLESASAANNRLFMQHNPYSTYQSHINMQNTKLGCCPNLEKVTLSNEAITHNDSTPFNVKPLEY